MWMHHGCMRRLVVVLAWTAAALAAPAVAAATTFTVDRTSDEDGFCSAGLCTLRQAINSANASPGADRIEFNIPPGGFQTIRPVGRLLPPITDPVTIDATTQPGYAGAPIIELNGDLVASVFSIGLDLVAGDNTVTGMLVDGFKPDGAAIFVEGPHNLLVGNYVGAVPGTPAISPNDYGIRAQLSPDNQFGGTNPRDRNVISGNNRDGILIVQSPRNVIQGNFVGTDPTGTTGAAVVTEAGIQIEQTNDTLVGGTVSGAANVISNNLSGIFINGDRNRIEGNFIGTDVTGTRPVGNKFEGVFIIVGAENVVGGGSANARNIISANGDVPGSGIGVLIESDLGGGDNTIQGNFIGADVNGAPLGNRSFGIFLGDAANGTLIGGNGPGDGNLIAFNDTQGIAAQVAAGLGNSILGNSIYANGSLGIDLPPLLVPNPNDPGDADTGPNDLQNFPVLTRSGPTEVQGTLNSHPNTIYRIQVFSNSACDPSGFGEGEELDSELDVTTDALGNAVFSVAAAPDRFITATATDPNGNTSEFSNCAQPLVGPGQVSGGGQTTGSAAEPISFGFFAKSDGKGTKGGCDVIDHGTRIHVKCLDATALAVSGTHATFSGPATVNGVATTYRIDVDDLGEPGVGRDTFRISTGTGYMAGGVLTAGNVQIHR